jgi:hypothetical protein
MRSKQALFVAGIKKKHRIKYELLAVLIEMLLMGAYCQVSRESATKYGNWWCMMPVLY